MDGFVTVPMMLFSVLCRHLLLASLPQCKSHLLLLRSSTYLKNVLRESCMSSRSLTGIGESSAGHLRKATASYECILQTPGVLFSTSPPKVSEGGITNDDNVQNTKQILLNNGCKEIELFECPEVLQLSPSEVKTRLRNLKLLNVALDVTPVMVSLAAEKKKSTLKTMVKKYQSKHGGHCSRARQLRSRLSLSDEDLQLLANSGAKLLHSAAKIKSVECLEWLLWKGYSLKEIAAVPEVLDKSIEVISGRHKDMTDFNVEHPPLQCLSLTHKQYHQLMRRFSVHPNAADAMRMTGERMHARSVVVANVKHMEPIWEFLRTQEFENDEIRRNAPKLLKVDFELLQSVLKSYKTLKSASTSLHMLILFCGDSVSSRKAALKELLGCSINDLPSAKRGSPFALLYAQEPAVYFQNLQFLLDAGFELVHVAKCPVIIGHHPQIVEHYWNYISAWDSSDVQGIKEDPVKYLEVLQYEIEKESNFLQGILM